MLGTGISVPRNDGFSIYVEEWKTAYLVHKLWQQIRRMDVKDHRIELTNNASLARTFPRIEFG
jgi:hypothetical protein